jgi:DNA-binding transcriptional ArsR family regulator
MSMDLMVKAMKARVGSPLRKLVLIKLADNANDLGECWPSYQHIADQCEMSRRSVMVHIDVLIKGGLLRKEIRKGGPKGNSSNVYFLQLSGGANLSLPPSAADAPPSESPAPGGESPALPPSESPAPRTSHSFEPVNEPVKEPLRPSAADDDAFELFWKSSLKNGSKKKALELFKAYCKRTGTPAMALAMILVNDTAARKKAQQFGFDRLHVTTYLSQERWNDEVPAADAGKPSTFATDFDAKEYKGTANEDFADFLKDD